MIVSTSLIPKRFDAITIWPFIFVRPKHRNNEALLVHEKVHLEEQRRSWLIPWWFKYATQSEFRLASEVRGYKAQVASGGISVECAAHYLTQYGIKGLTYEQALSMLTSKEVTTS